MMRTWHRGVAILLVSLTVIVALLVAIAWAVLPLEGITVTADGRTFPLAELTTGLRGVVFFVVAVAAGVIAIVAALSMVVVGLGFGAIGLVFGLLTAATSLALVVAPFALVGWLVWRLARPRAAVVATTP